MNNKAITQHYWVQQAQTVQPPKAAEKPRKEKPQVINIIKHEFADRETRIISILIAVFLLLGIASQLMITAGVLSGPMYFSDFVR